MLTPSMRVIFLSLLHLHAHSIVFKVINMQQHTAGMNAGNYGCSVFFLFSVWPPEMKGDTMLLKCFRQGVANMGARSSRSTEEDH